MQMQGGIPQMPVGMQQAHNAMPPHMVQDEGPPPDPCNLIVNYIPTPVTDAELGAIFSQHGELMSARVIVDRQTKHPKGYGFVKYRCPKQAAIAMVAMNGFEIHGKRLKVTAARGSQSESIAKYLATTGDATGVMQQQQRQAPRAIPSFQQPHMQPHAYQQPQAFQQPMPFQGPNAGYVQMEQPKAFYDYSPPTYLAQQLALPPSADVTPHAMPPQ
jgi:RNA recognition motif-containing protein